MKPGNLAELRLCVLLFGFLACCVGNSFAAETLPNLEFDISYPESIHTQPITGRLLLIISRKSEPELRLQVGYNSPPVFGIDVQELKPWQNAVINRSTLGSPLNSLSQLPSGDYYVQALLNVYTDFHRSNGHVIWAHMDQWEGQRFNVSPGNLYSKVQKLHLDGSRAYQIKLSLTEVISPVNIPADTEWVKHIKIQSKLLSDFWGRPMYLGAVVLLPEKYESQPKIRYPVVYQQDHFSQIPPFGFDTEDRLEKDRDRQARMNLGVETGHEFYQAWSGDRFPRMIAVTFLHPTPYYDDSYAVNSVNVGPYGDAILTELIPYIEEHFRIIREPYARILTGGSTGGWEALALQLFHPDFFGGAWVLYPDPIDFRRYLTVNIYEDENAFVADPSSLPEWAVSDWSAPERPLLRTEDGQVITTVRQLTRLEDVLGSKGRSGGFLENYEAVFGPIGQDGYPEPLWDKSTGVINHRVADYMRNHGYDLRYYAEKNWHDLGPQLVGKLHFYCGDMDNFYLNLATYLFEEFAKNTKDPYYGGSFDYGRPTKGHGWQPVTNAQLMRMIAEHIARNSPPSADLTWKNN